MQTIHVKILRKFFQKTSTNRMSSASIFGHFEQLENVSCCWCQHKQASFECVWYEFRKIDSQLIWRRDKQRIWLFYARVNSRYAIFFRKLSVSDIQNVFSDMQITSVWCISDFFTFLSIIQTKFCIFINSGRNSCILLLKKDGKQVYFLSHLP